MQNKLLKKIKKNVTLNPKTDKEQKSKETRQTKADKEIGEKVTAKRMQLVTAVTEDIEQ